MSPGFGLDMAGRNGGYLENDAINGGMSGWLLFYSHLSYLLLRDNRPTLM